MKHYIVTLILFACIFGVVLLGTEVMSGKADDEGADVLRDAIRRASVQCYAIEGSYPPSAEYLIENYGIKVDESKYTVRYSGFASNIMPEITVIQKETE